MAEDVEKVYIQDDIIYVDEAGNDLPASDIDMDKGYVVEDSRLKEHHDAVAATEEKYHYVLDTWYFEDDTSLDCTGTDNQDPHIKVINDQTGDFEYVDQGEGKTYRGASISRVIDVEYSPAIDAYDEYEIVYRYIPYTEEELATRAEEREKQEKTQEFMNNGPDQLSNNTDDITSLMTMVSEMVGVA